MLGCAGREMNLELGASETLSQMDRGLSGVYMWLRKCAKGLVTTQKYDTEPSTSRNSWPSWRRKPHILEAVLQDRCSELT